MAANLTAAEAAARLPDGRAGLTRALDAGRLARRRRGRAAFWPEEVDTLALRVAWAERLPVLVDLAPLAAFARALSALDDSDEHERATAIATTAARCALLLTEARTARVIRLSPEPATVAAEGDAVNGAGGLDAPAVAFADLIETGIQRLGRRLPVVVPERGIVLAPLLHEATLFGVLAVEGLAFEPDGTDPSWLPPLLGLVDLAGAAFGAALVPAEPVTRNGTYPAAAPLTGPAIATLFDPSRPARRSPVELAAVARLASGAERAAVYLRLTDRPAPDADGTALPLAATDPDPAGFHEMIAIDGEGCVFGLAGTWSVERSPVHDETDEPAGLVVTVRRTDDEFSPAANRWLRSLGEQLGPWVLVAPASPAVADAAGDRLPDRTRALLRVASAVAGIERLDDLLPALARGAAEAVGADQASVYVYDERRRRTVAAGHYAAGDRIDVASIAKLEDLDPLPPTALPAEAEIIRTGRPLLRDTTTPFPDPVPIVNWRSDVVVPLLAQGEVQGALYVREFERERVFEPDDLALLEAIGRQAGLAVLRAREAATAARRADHLAVLNRVGHALTLGLDEDELCVIVHEQVRHLLPVDAFFVGLVEAERGELRLPYLFDAGRRWPDARVPLDQGPAGQAVRTGQPCLVGRWGEPVGDEVPRFGDPERHVESAVFVPMHHDGRVLGVLSAQRYDDGDYDVDDVQTLETVAQQAAAAFANARLFAETVAARGAAEGHAADLAAVLAITRAIASAPDQDGMLATLADRLGDLLAHDELVLFRLGRDEREPRLVPILARKHGADLLVDGWTMTPGQGLVGAAFASGEAMLVNDAHLDPRTHYLADDPTPYLTAGEHALVAPLVVAGQPIGVLYVNRIGGRPFAEEEFGRFRVLAEQAAVAIRNAMLREEAERASAAQARQAANLEAVLAVSRSIASATDLRTMLGVLADELATLIPHREVALYRLAEDGRLVAELYRKEGVDTDASAWSLAVGQGVIGSAFARGEAELVNDAHRDPRSVYYDDEESYRDRGEHTMQAPLVVGGQPIGVLHLSRDGQQPFAEEEFATFRALAAEAAVAIHNAALLDEARAAREQTARHAADLEAVLAVTRSITTAGDLDRMVEVLAAELARLVPHDVMTLLRIDPEEAVLRPLFHRDPGLPQIDFEPARWRVRVGEGIVGTVFETGRAECIAHMERDPRVRYPFDPSYLAARGEHAIVVPFVLGDRPTGVLFISRIGGVPFGDDEFVLCRVLAEQAAVAIHNAALLEEARAARAQLARHAANLEATLAVARAIGAAPDLAGKLDVLAGELAALVPHDGLYVYRLQADGTSLHPIFLREQLADRMADGDEVWRLNVGLGIVGHTAASGLAELVHDAHRDPRSWYPFDEERRRAGPQHVITAPLLVDGRVTGVLFLDRVQRERFTEEEFTLVRVLAEHAATALHGAALLEETRAARERSERQAGTLGAVLAAGLDLARQTDLAATLGAIEAGLERLIPYTCCSVLRFEEATESLRLIHVNASCAPAPVVERIAVGEGIGGQAFARLEPVCLAHAEHDPRLNRAVWGDNPNLEPMLATGIHLISVPLLVEGTALGVLAVHRYGSVPGPFTDDEFAAVRLFAGQAAAAIRNAELASQNRDLYLGGIRALASAVDQKDQYTRGHSERVSAYARRIADELGLARSEAERVELAGLLHDIGKIGVPDKILQKPGQLTASERAVMMEHAAIGARMLAESGAAALQPLVPLVRHHHEHVDGRGYPDGLAGEAIPLGAAIIAIADAFDTMVTNRPYRAKRPVPDALAELRRCAGTQFHPGAVAALERVVAADPEQPARLERATSHQSDGIELSLPADDGSSAAEDEHGRTRAGQMGDPRPLWLLTELAEMTRHMPDLATYLDRVTTALRKLDYEDVTLFLAEPESGRLRLAAHAGSLRRAAVGIRQPLGRGTAGAVAVRGEPLNVGNVASLPGSAKQWSATSGSELSVPLIVEAATIGVLSVASAAEAAFSKTDETVLALIAEHIATAVHVAQLHADARRAAIHDGLTGVLNHRAFYEELEHATAGGRPLAIVLFDVEGLKATNDSGGHLAGDALLRRVADTIRAAVRAGDVVARYGGDEFGAILHGADLATAETVAARIRQRLLATAGATGELPTTVRYGVAVLPDDGTSPYDLVGMADTRLYEMRSRLGSSRAPLLVGRAS